LLPTYVTYLLNIGLENLYIVVLIEMIILIYIFTCGMINTQYPPKIRWVIMRTQRFNREYKYESEILIGLVFALPILNPNYCHTTF
jgi:hypothetical protein